MADLSLLLVIGRSPEFLTRWVSLYCCLRVLMMWQLASPRAIDLKSERAQKESAVPLWPSLSLGITCCDCCHILFVRSKLLSTAYIQGEKNQASLFEGERICRRILKSPQGVRSRGGAGIPTQENHRGQPLVIGRTGPKLPVSSVRTRKTKVWTPGISEEERRKKSA